MIDIEQFPGYKLGTKQRIYSMRTKRYLKPGTNNTGYKILCLMRHGKKVMVKRARLIYSIFNGPIPKGMTVNHINLNKTDDRPINLESLTRGDNVRHYYLNRSKKHATRFSKWV